MREQIPDNPNSPDPLTELQSVSLSDPQSLIVYFLEYDRRSGKHCKSELELGTATWEDVCERIKWAQYSESLSEVIQLAQKVLPRLLTHRGLVKRDLNAINDLLCIHPPPPVIFLPEDDSATSADDFVPSSKIEVVEIEPIASLVQWLLNDLRDATLYPERLARCEECQRIFLRKERAPDAIYCSRRCGDRVRQRRHTVRKKGITGPVSVNS